MHRSIEIAISPEATDELIEGLQSLEDVIALSVSRGTSIKPPGDIVTVTSLNRAANEVMRCAQGFAERTRVVIVTLEATSINDLEQQERIENDLDEELWEEMETGLRHSTHVTTNFLGLMALGGAVATVGVVEHGVAQGISFVAASIIAPGFEPLAKFPMGLVLGSGAVARRALVSASAGYAALMAGAAVTMIFLRTMGLVNVEEISKNAELFAIMGTGTPQNLLTFFGALAGMIMIASSREEVIAGPLIALALIPSAAMSGATFGIAAWDLFEISAIRCALDMMTIMLTAVVFFWIKQRLVHKRKPML